MVPQVEVLRHITDVHCHPTDSEISTEEMMALPITICAMATRQSDQILVAELARAYPQKVIPCFGEKFFNVEKQHIHHLNHEYR